MRRHAHLTLEHLLFAVAHDPEGEEILEASGADVARLRARARRVPGADHASGCPRTRERPPQQTLAFRRVLQTAVAPRAERGQGRGRRGRHAGRAPARSRAPMPWSSWPRRASRASTSSTTSPTASRKVAVARGRGRRADPGRRARGGGAARPAIRSRPTPSNLTERARAGQARPADRPRARDAARARGAVPPAQEQPGVRGRGRRRQDRARRGPGPAAARAEDVPEVARRAPRSSRSTPARCSPARATAATSRSASRRVIAGAQEAAEADPVHRRDAHHGRRRRHHRRHDGPRQPGQADPHRGRDPPDGLDHLRGVQAHREGPRARAGACRRSTSTSRPRGRQRADPAGAASRATRSTTR